MIDLDRVRADTSAADSLIHLNNSGSSLPPRPVVDAVVEYLRLEESTGGYEAADLRAADLDELYSATATYLGCGPEEVAFTSSASDAWWRAFSSVPLTSGDRILIGRSEFQTGAFGFLQARDRGVFVDVVPNDENGTIDLEALSTMVSSGDVKAVSLTQISMSNGAVQPAAEVGAIARSVGAIFILDACQAAGQRPLDVEALACDFLVYTGRKFMRGPRGTGVLYARNSIIDRLAPSPFVDGRSAEWSAPWTYHLQPHARRFEFGEQNFAGKIGLALATRYMLDIGIEHIADRVTNLAEVFRVGLSAIEGVTVHDEGTDRCGIVTFTIDGQNPATTQRHLREQHINVSAPGKRNAQLDLGERGIDAVVRAGVHYFNSENDIERAQSVIADLASRR